MIPNRKNKNRIFRFFRFVYLKLFRINDSPHKIALGFGLGVFFGVMPGMGPAVALFFAFLLRVNKAAALAGSLLTNTWLSIPTFVISAKIGSRLTGVNYSDISAGWNALIKDLRWGSLLHASLYTVAMPILAGYVAVSLAIGISAYTMILLLLTYRRSKRLAKKMGAGK